MRLYRVIALVVLTGLLAGCSTQVQTSEVTKTAPISFDNLDPAQVRPAAFAEVNKAIKSMGTATADFKINAGPSLAQGQIDTELASLRKAASFWADIYDAGTSYIVYYTEKDVAWVDGAACKQANYCPSGSQPKISQFIKNEAPFCMNAFSDLNKAGRPFFAQCLGSGSERQKNRQTGPHEYFHWVQKKYANWQTTPNWFLEGSADYFGDAISIATGTGVPKEMDAMQHEPSKNWMDQDKCPISSPMETAIAKCFRYTYNQEQGPNTASSWPMSTVSYYMGSLATEALVAVKGLAEFKAFLVDLKSTKFDDAFEKHFGLSADDFYVKVSKYIFKMYADGR